MLSVWNSSVSFGKACWSFAEKVVAAIQYVVGPQNYIFFNGNPAPYRVGTVNEKASGSAAPQWFFNADQAVFLDVEDVTLANPQPLPILSLEIVLDGKAFYDLTDYLERVRVYSATGRNPSIQHIIGAWSLSSGIVLDHARGFEAHMILTNGSSVVLDPYDTEPVGTEPTPSEDQEPLEEGEVRETEQTTAEEKKND